MVFQIIIKSSILEAKIIEKALSRLTPTNIKCPNVRTSHDGELTPSNNVCIIDGADKQFCCHWSGVLPNKCRTCIIINNIISLLVPLGSIPTEKSAAVKAIN
jgi:hypothetical protein